MPLTATPAAMDKLLNSLDHPPLSKGIFFHTLYSTIQRLQSPLRVFVGWARNL